MSLRVAFVLSQFPALSETFVINQVTGLLDRGVEVEVLAAHLAQQTRLHADVEEYDLIGRTRYGRPVADGMARRLGVARILGSAVLRRVRSVADLRWLIRHGRRDAGTALPFHHHARHLSRRRYDAILCHFGPQGQWGMALRNVGLLDGPLVTVFHGYDMSRFFREEGERVYDRLFREGDLFLPVSEFWRRRLLELGCPADRTVVHRMGVDLRDFRFEPRLPPGREPLRLLSVARLTEKKGLDYGIRAVAELAGAGMDVRYEIVGSGPDADSLRDLVGSLGLGDRVTLLGPRPKEEVLRVMAQSHIFLAPSVTAVDGNQEGLPVVLMEALATGLPVVSTRHTGIPELIEHGVTGMLADERDVAGLVEGVRALVADPALYTSVAEQGLRRVTEQHDINSLNDRLLALLSGTSAKGEARGDSTERRLGTRSDDRTPTARGDDAPQPSIVG